MHNSNFKILRRDLFFILLIFIAALLLRALYINDYMHTDTFPVLAYSDAYSYLLWGKDIASGDLLGSKAFMKWPFYAYFLALLFKILGNSVTSIYIFQFILGAINCVLIYFVAKFIFNEVIAFIAALLCVWYGLFIFYDGLLIYTSLSLFLNSLLFLFLLHIGKSLDKKNLFWAGIFLGICAITQANSIIFGIAAIPWILWEKRLSLVKSGAYFLLFFFGLSIIMGTVTLRNYLVEKDFVLISGNIGVNFYLGNNPQATGTFYCPIEIASHQEGMFRDAKIIAESDTNRKLKTSEVSQFWFNKALGFIKSEPLAYLKLLFQKLIYLFRPKESVHELEYLSIANKAKIFKIMFLDLSFILPFAFLGMFLNLKKLKETALLYIVLAVLSFSIILFFVATRYRIAMVPFLAIFAASGIFGIIEAVKQKRYLKFSWLCIALILVFILSNRQMFAKNATDESQEKFSSWNYHLRKAQIYIDTKDYPRALEEANLSLRIEPNNHYCLLSLGSIYYRMHDFRMAEDKYKEAIRIFPFSVDAYYNLGLLYNDEQQFREAKIALEKAVFLDPEDIGAHFELGRAYKASGDLERARKEFSAALNKINRWRINERATIAKELADLRP